MAEKLLLIDGHSIINRAFYAIPDMTGPKGDHTNGIYGFLNIMLKYIQEEKPDRICVAFDSKAPTFRHEIYGEYKGTRKGMPQELREQVPVLKELLETMEISVFSRPGWEADDILGSLARRGEAEGMDVTIVSGDRDLLQIATDRIKLSMPKTKGNKTETEEYYSKDVLEKYQVTPAGIIELKALMGDSSDNIPGVPKVGEKTATALLVEYGTVDGVYENIDKITKKTLHENLVNFKEQAILSRTLATIKTDCDIPLEFSEMGWDRIWNDNAMEMLAGLGFKSLIARINRDREAGTGTILSIGNTGANGAASNGIINNKVLRAYELLSCASVEQLENYLTEAGKDPINLFFHQEASERFIFMSKSTEDLNILTVAGKLCGDSFGIIKRKCKEGLRIKGFDVKSFCRNMDFEEEGEEIVDIFTESFQDVLLMAYLNNPLKNDTEITDLGIEFLDLKAGSYKELFGKAAFSQLIREKPKELAAYIGNCLYIIGECTPILLDKLRDKGMLELYRNIELPLSMVLASMEKQGIIVDRDSLGQYGEKLSVRLSELEKEIYGLAGQEFNLNSPKQLGEILFEKLGYPGGKKTKTGYSTAAAVLEDMAGDYPIVGLILEYRTLAKLKSTYAEGLISCIGEDGKIHTTFNQTITATGRISSTEPNLQNIPIRTSLGREIRRCFVARPGYCFIDADYSQIELRLMAHMSGDRGLIEAFESHEDIHSATASKVFHVPFDEVTPEMRRNAKAVNFGIVYGISAFGLGKDLGIGRQEAEKYIQDYFATYPAIKEYLDNCVNNAREKGYVTTLYGRIRPIPELKSSNFQLRSFGERVAMNSPLQGTGADIMKLAMINVYKALKREKIDGCILLQVHDELLLEVKETEVQRASELLQREMEETAALSVRLEAQVEQGHNWYDAK